MVREHSLEAPVYPITLEIVDTPENKDANKRATSLLEDQGMAEGRDFFIIPSLPGSYFDSVPMPRLGIHSNNPMGIIPRFLFGLEGIEFFLSKYREEINQAYGD